MPSPHFLSCDWGTSHFRLRLIDTTDLAVRAEVCTEEGAARLSQQTTPENRAQLFADVLSRHATTVGQQAGCRVDRCVVSGMASSSIGWRELPYAVAPLPLTAEHLETCDLTIPLEGESLSVRLVSGVRTADDVMRGEECELHGLLELHPGLGNGRACVLLPGTHSKHIHLKGRVLENFLTFMTGELFTHLRGLPTLKAPLAAEGERSERDFRDGVRVARQLGLSAGLFKIRTRALLGQAGDNHAPSFLSGLLIGTELLGLRGEDEVDVFLAGSPVLHPLYLQAGEELGLTLNSIPPEILQRALLHAHRNLL